MKVSLQKAEQMLRDMFVSSGASEKDVATLTKMRLEYDLHQNTFSGFEHAEDDVKALAEKKDRKYTIEVDRPSIKLINGQGKMAELIGMDVVEMVSKMAKETGIGMVGIYNSTYHGILETYSRAIAEHDVIAIVSANGGPQGVVPFGGKKDLFGTNPISYGIPSKTLPIVFDGATAKYAYGSIRLAKKRGQKLPEKGYLDEKGAFTTDPHQAKSIVPFGEHKGYAINLLLEVLTGSLVQAKMGLLSQSEADLGSFFIAIDPSAFGPIGEFKAAVSQLISEIEAVEPLPGFSAVHVPGIRGEKLKQKFLEDGYIEVEDTIWDDFEKVYEKIIG